MSDSRLSMSPLEKDALQEIMNIAFGQAAGDLSEVINVYVTLSVPHIDLLAFDEILTLLTRELHEKADVSMVRQFFSGRFKGSSVLIFPHGEGKKLLRIFQDNTKAGDDSGYEAEVLEKETLIEISNIIMGACISKIAQMLGDVVTYTPPRYYSQEQILSTLKDSFVGHGSYAILFKTVFQFKEFNASGLLFVICEEPAIDWLKKVIADFLAQYD